MCANHGLASGAQLVSQFVEEEKEGNHGGMNWKENCRGGEGGCALSHVGKNVLSVTFFRSVLRGVKGIRSLSRRANSRLAELSGTARESEAGRRDGRP